MGAIPDEVATRMTGKRKQADLDNDYNASKGQPIPESSSKKLKLESILNVEELSPKKAAKGKGKQVESKPEGKAKDEEKRLRRFRQKAPQSYLEIKSRALTQRMIVQGRERRGTDEVPEEKVLIAGSTGNLYTVHIGRVPSCNCPHAKKGNQCKHIIYVMLRVLKARESIGYQLALISSELRELFEKAPAVPNADGEVETSDGNRKPIEGDCPICYTEFEPGKEAIVYCKAACGNNIHKACMDNWAKASHGKVSCPMCRSAWDEAEISTKKANLEGATTNEDGYINVADQLGLSGERDYSSYHPHWVRRQGRGEYTSSRRRYGGW